MILLYRVLKQADVKRYLDISPKKTNKGKFNPNLIFAKILVGSGILIVANVIWPIIAYELFTAPSLKKQEFLSPIPISRAFQLDQENIETVDLSDPQNWFPDASYSQDNRSKITHYTLSIPKLRIKDAVVEIDGTDLSRSLIQYPGTALPGKLGSTIIFGHSVLPQFFNPKNYMTIFSLIPTLEIGDEITIKFDGITYSYQVLDKEEVLPSDISVLQQNFSNEYLKLITCTPPGTYLRRGVITATLVD